MTISQILAMLILLYEEASNADFSMPQTFGPIPGSAAKHKGNWTVIWTPNPTTP